VTPSGSLTVRVVRRVGPKRTRLFVEELYRRDDVKRDLERRLSGLSGVLAFRVNALTARVLVVHDREVEPEVLVDALSREGAEPTADRPRSIESPPLASDPVPRRAKRAPWHARSVEEVRSELDVSLRTGLVTDDVVRRRQRFGVNALPRPIPRSDLEIALDQFRSLPVSVLGVSAVVSIATGGLLDAAMIGAVVVVNAAIGYRTEAQSERVLSRLATGIEPGADVRRDRQRWTCSGRELVPGDIVFLERGTYVPADIRIVSAEHLTIDESALTGESEPARKSTDPVAHDAPLGERRSMAYRETVITGGSGVGIVVETGTRTEVGHIRALASEATPPETSMQRQIRQLGRQVVAGSAALCAGVVVLGLARRWAPLELAKLTISLAVAAIPEGLPTVATTTLAFGVEDLEAQQVLVRRLAALESLGMLEALGMDKTGTLTRNRMELVAMRVDGAQWDLGGEVAVDRSNELLRELLVHCALCSTVSRDDDGQLVGTPTELALIHRAEALGIDVDAEWRQRRLVLLEDRTKGRNFMKAAREDSRGQRIVSIKGRPDEVLDQCSSIVTRTGLAPLAADERSEIVRENERLAGRALRVLGVAREHPGEGVAWLGLAGLYDPPRPGLPDLMDAFHRAGIHTAMITGDQSATAQAIADDIRLSTGESLEILDSTRIEEIEPEILESLSRRVDVFSRVSPAHKLQIVQALQRSGLVVGMTGDGVNDGPALRAADIGIAMGRSGTDVAKDIADIVLEDDDLWTLLPAIAQGRRIYDDIRKSLRFMLSSNASEILVTASSIAAGAPSPLNAMQLLWINVLTDIFPEIALSIEPPEFDVMSRPPRSSTAPMFDSTDLRRMGFESLLMTAAGLASYGYGLSRYGPGPRASTLAFSALTSAQLLHAVSCRSEPHGLFDGKLPKNPWIPLSVGGGLLLQLGAVLVPGLRRLLGTTPLGPADWLVCGTCGVLPFFAIEFGKLIRHGEPRSAS